MTLPILKFWLGLVGAGNAFKPALFLGYDYTYLSQFCPIKRQKQAKNDNNQQQSKFISH